ncbi:MAG: hypothetical protein K2J76_03170, partial [Oscillospiraceae bacterium]|nr:hypothetical protein [Oscillospiraceae bacterium]
VPQEKAEIAAAENGNAEIAEETRETVCPEEENPTEEVKEEVTQNIQKEETAEIVKETRKTPFANEEKTEISEKFNKKDGLYVVSGQSAEMSEIKKETGNFPTEKRKFPVFKVIAAVLLVSISVTSVYFIYEKAIPDLRYKNAEKLFSQADYDAAEEIFAELGNYSESSDYIIRCRYERASELMANGQYPEAADAFTLLDGYGNSDELVQECMLKIAEEHMENGEFEAAMSVYKAAGKGELAETAAAERAEKYAAEGDYFAAYDLAERYCGSDISTEYFYLGAEKARKDGDFKTAADSFYKLGNYKNSAELAEECTYEFYRAEYAKNGASEETTRGFYFLGDFRDSYDMYLQNAYEYGVKCFDEENFAAAAAMFRNAVSYKDSGGQLYLARYELAKSLENDDPASAKSIFSMLGNYRDSASHKSTTARKVSESWYADGYTSVGDYCTTFFRRNDMLTVYCTAGTDSQSGPVSVVLTLTDESGNTASAEYENLRNSGSFSVNFPLNDTAKGKAEVSVARKDNGALLRSFEITVAE